MFSRFRQNIGILGLLVAGIAFPASSWATAETQSALSALARARSATVSQHWSAAGNLLSEARRSLSFLRREPQLREAVRAIDDAQETLYGARFDGRGVVINVLRSIREAEYAILTSDAHRFGGGYGPGHPGGHPGGAGRVECRAVDRGWEEHRGGHVAEGFNEFVVRQRALNECQRYHGRCHVTCRAVR